MRSNIDSLCVKGVAGSLVIIRYSTGTECYGKARTPGKYNMYGYEEDRATTNMQQQWKEDAGHVFRLHRGPFSLSLQKSGI